MQEVYLRGLPSEASPWIEGYYYTEEPEVTISNCCENGKIFRIWVLLSAFDESELLFQKQTIESTPSSYHHQPAFKGTGTGYASGRAFTNRYQMWNPYAASDLSFPQLVGNDEMQDKVKTDVLQMLLPFLPSSNSKPVPELVALFRLSLLVDCAAVLLRNDSITDMAKRKNLYHALFAFLTTITKCRPLLDILLEQRPTKKRSPGLQALGEEANQKSFMIDASPEGLAPSLVSCGEKLKNMRTLLPTLQKTRLLGRRLSTDVTMRHLPCV